MKTVTFDEAKWKLVPLDPDYKQINAAYSYISNRPSPKSRPDGTKDFSPDSVAYDGIYRAMVKDAPAHPEAVESRENHIGDSTEIVSRTEIAWEATGNGLVKHVTDERYQKFSPEIKRWYKPYRCASCTESRAEIEARALEEAAKVCDELEENWSAYKDTALLNGDMGLSIAASGEPRAARFIAGHLRQLAAEKRAGAV